MQISEFQEKTVFHTSPEIKNKTQLAETLLTLSVGLMAEVGELSSVLQKGIAFSDTLNKVDVIDEISDVTVYLSLMLTSMGINYEDVLDANYHKLRLRFGDGGYKKDYKHEKLFFKNLV
jgi:NTP pyrophosphatase (non-canonical NTP hydrolase)